MNNTVKMIIPIIVGIIVALLPTPAGLDPNAQYFFAVFLAVIVALILEPIPAALIGLIGVSFSATFGLGGSFAIWSFRLKLYTNKITNKIYI